MLLPFAQPSKSGNHARFYVLDLFDRWHICTVSRNKQTIQPPIGFCRMDHCNVIDCNVWTLHYILQEILSQSAGRLRFIRVAKSAKSPLALRLVPPAKEIIDYKWNQLNEHTAFTQIELDHLTSWLSTLGGGYSALGDSMDQCASIAGRISIYQFRLALQFGDPPLVARSKLYMAIALIQKRRLRMAKHLTRTVYHEALADRDVDTRLLNMCHGIWLKLQWSYTQRGVRAA